MALKKEITMGNGITVGYHRVVSVHDVVGVQTTIEVGSYTSEKYRELEKKSLDNPGFETDGPYIATSWFPIPYVDGMTASAAYDYIKTLPEFSGAEDV